MTHAYHHAQSSARSFGGVPEDYLAIHNWLVLIWTVKWVRTIARLVPLSVLGRARPDMANIHQSCWLNVINSGRN